MVLATITNVVLNLMKGFIRLSVVTCIFLWLQIVNRMPPSWVTALGMRILVWDRPSHSIVLLDPVASHLFLFSQASASGTRRYLTLRLHVFRFPNSLFLPFTFHLKHRILDLLEALDTALHFLRRRIVSPLSMLMDVQFVAFAFLAIVLSLHDILPQDLGDGLHMLDCVVDLF